MSNHDEELSPKVVRLQENVDSIKELLRIVKDDVDELYKHTANLNTSVVLLRQSIETLNKSSESRKGILEKVGMFIVGGFLAAAISWIIRGGLAP